MPLTVDDVVAAINAASVTSEELTAVVAGGKLLVERNVLLAKIENARRDMTQSTETINARIQQLTQELAALDAVINSQLGTVVNV